MTVESTPTVMPEADARRLTPLQIRALDALDEAPQGWISGYGVAFSGTLATVQWLANALTVSDTTARKVIHSLRVLGWVTVWDALDPQSRRRRLYVSGEARS